LWYTLAQKDERWESRAVLDVVGAGNLAPAFPREHASRLFFSPLLSAAHKLDNSFWLEVIMKKFFARAIVAFALVFAVTVPVLADTIRLKDGSVIRGQIVSFKNEQFTILVGGGSRGRKSQITVYMEDVESIDFDSSGNASNTESANSQTYQQPSNPPYQPPVNQQPVNTQPTNNQPTNNQPVNTSTQPSTNPNPTFFPVNVKVRADNASNGWTNSGLVVRRGQRLRITANGRVSLGGGRFATPDGMANLPDRDKLMKNSPTGGLICVIGDDNDDFIFIGRSRDFVAQKDGVLFLGVNEGNLSDNTGTFDVVIEAEALNSRPD
jgi:hypothetical protein